MKLFVQPLETVISVSLFQKLVPGISDLQRIDMGIAMCHFQLGAMEKNLSGSWQKLTHPPGNGMGEYTISWTGEM